MRIRTQRIIQWGLTLVIAALIWQVGGEIKSCSEKPEKQVLTVNAPSNMEGAFKQALKNSSLKETHKIVMSNNANANICVEYEKQDDESYEKFAFSPFVIAYSTDTDSLDKLKKSKVCMKSEYDDSVYEIDFLKIINETIGEAKWENLGIKENGKLKVFYPDKESIYWNDYYDFMLVTLNGGLYPETETEIQEINKTIELFVNSKCTQGVIDFDEQARRTGGFPTSVIYVLPEAEVINIACDQSEDVRLIFPLNTVYFNYYVRGDELGSQVIEAFEKTSLWGSFYSALYTNGYRSLDNSELSETVCSRVYDIRNTYNVVKIPETNQTITTSQPKSE